MEKLSDNEKKVRSYYEDVWSDPFKMERGGEDLYLGCHYGLWEKGIKNKKEAFLNMNDFVGRLICLDNNKKMKILDAGCGVGATSIYLAKKYPNIDFTGITLAPSEVLLAKKLQKEKQVNNTEFIVENYLDTGLPDNYFDGVFALESLCYTQNQKTFVNEMYRVLKSGGKIAILEGFLKDDTPFNPIMKKIFNAFLVRRSVPALESLTAFKSYMLMAGFEKIDIMDLAEKGNVGAPRIQVYVNFLINFFRFLSSQLKMSLNLKNYEPTKDLNYVRGAAFLEYFLGLSKKTGYFAITAVKK